MAANDSKTITIALTADEYDIVRSALRVFRRAANNDAEKFGATSAAPGYKAEADMAGDLMERFRAAYTEGK